MVTDFDEAISLHRSAGSLSENNLGLLAARTINIRTWSHLSKLMVVNIMGLKEAVNQCLIEFLFCHLPSQKNGRQVNYFNKNL